MPLLLDTDYEELRDRSVSFLEVEASRFVIFRDLQLPPSLYTQPSCDVLVEIPANYNQAGNDMFWTHPRLTVADGRQVPASSEVGAGENKHHDSIEYCRWSRHWFDHTPSKWRPGIDNVVSILRRVTWSLENPFA